MNPKPQPGLFDRPSPPQAAKPGEAERDQEIARAEQGAPDDWRADAAEAVRHCCAMLDTFTTDDVWAALGYYFPSEGRAMGAVMKDAQRRGWCRPTPRFKPSGRPVCHRSPKRVWESLAPKMRGSTRGR